MRVFSTKYALTSGISEFPDATQISAGMVKVSDKFGGAYLHGEGKDWHVSIEGAKKRAEEMRKNKIVSLRRSLAKLEAMKF